MPGIESGAGGSDKQRPSLGTVPGGGLFVLAYMRPVRLVGDADVAILLWALTGGYLAHTACGEGSAQETFAGFLRSTAHKMRKERQMREEYDFSQGIKNPYTGQQKTCVTITVDRETMDYFRRLSAETGIPCRTLMGSYLTDCAARRRPVPSWTANADNV